MRGAKWLAEERGTFEMDEVESAVPDEHLEPMRVPLIIVAHMTGETVVQLASICGMKVGNFVRRYWGDDEN